MPSNRRKTPLKSRRGVVNRSTTSRVTQKHFVDITPVKKHVAGDSSPGWVAGELAVFKSPSPSPRRTRRSTAFHQISAQNRQTRSLFKTPATFAFTSPPGIKTRSRRSSVYFMNGDSIIEKVVKHANSLSLSSGQKKEVTQVSNLAKEPARRLSVQQKKTPAKSQISKIKVVSPVKMQTRSKQADRPVTAPINIKRKQNVIGKVESQAKKVRADSDKKNPPNPTVDGPVVKGKSSTKRYVAKQPEGPSPSLSKTPVKDDKLLSIRRSSRLSKSSSVKRARPQLCAKDMLTLLDDSLTINTNPSKSARSAGRSKVSGKKSSKCAESFVSSPIFEQSLGSSPFPSTKNWMPNSPIKTPRRKLSINSSGIVGKEEKMSPVNTSALKSLQKEETPDTILLIEEMKVLNFSKLSPVKTPGKIYRNKKPLASTPIKEVQTSIKPSPVKTPRRKSFLTKAHHSSTPVNKAMQIPVEPSPIKTSVIKSLDYKKSISATPLDDVNINGKTIRSSTPLKKTVNMYVTPSPVKTPGIISLDDKKSFSATPVKINGKTSVSMPLKKAVEPSAVKTPGIKSLDDKKSFSATPVKINGKTSVSMPLKKAMEPSPVKTPGIKSLDDKKSFSATPVKINGKTSVSMPLKKAMEPSPVKTPGIKSLDDKKSFSATPVKINGKTSVSMPLKKAMEPSPVKTPGIKSLDDKKSFSATPVKINGKTSVSMPLKKAMEPSPVKTPGIKSLDDKKSHSAMSVKMNAKLSTPKSSLSNKSMKTKHRKNLSSRKLRSEIFNLSCDDSPIKKSDKLSNSELINIRKSLRSLSHRESESISELTKSPRKESYKKKSIESQTYSPLINVEKTKLNSFSQITPVSKLRISSPSNHSTPKSSSKRPTYQHQKSSVKPKLIKSEDHLFQYKNKNIERLKLLASEISPKRPSSVKSENSVPEIGIRSGRNVPKINIKSVAAIISRKRKHTKSAASSSKRRRHEYSNDNPLISSTVAHEKSAMCLTHAFKRNEVEDEDGKLSYVRSVSLNSVEELDVNQTVSKSRSWCSIM